MTLGDLIEEALARLGWTATQLADRMGVAKGQVSNWRAGSYSPRKKNLRKLARVIRVPYETVVQAVAESRYR